MHFIVAVCKDAELLRSINRRGDQEDSPLLAGGIRGSHPASWDLHQPLSVVRGELSSSLSSPCVCILRVCSSMLFMRIWWETDVS